MVQVVQVMTVVQVVHVVRMISLDDKHSENMWFKWSENGKWKTGDPSGPGGPSSLSPCDLIAQNGWGY